jgi:hypothetical protein
MAYGFKPVRVYGAAAATPNCVNDYAVASGYSENIFTGDPVKMTTDGTIILATVGAPILGIFAGVEFTAANGDIKFSKYWPDDQVATNIKAYVYDDPKTVFIVESDQDTTALVAADKGTNCDLIAGTGSTTTGQSAYSVDSSTSGVGSDIGTKVLGSAEEDDSFGATGTPSDVYVLLNEHFYSAPTAGI